MKTASHVAFSDESCFNDRRYRSIAVVSLSRQHSLTLHHELRSLLQECGIRELRWQRVSSARERFGAIRIIDRLFQELENRRIRIDSLIWDTHDSRHQVQGRNELGNLQRMYYHLFKDVLTRRWRDDATWALYPDEQTGLRWSSLQTHLSNAEKSLDVSPPAPLFEFEGLIISLRRQFHLRGLGPLPSHSTPFIQVADLFAGIAAFSWNCHDCYKRWESSQGPAQGVFTAVTQSPSFTKSERERCPVLNHLDNKCKARRFQIGLSSTKGLKSHRQDIPLRFWLYVPQHAADKAPTTPQ
jgi:hypothetical protein